MDGTVRLQEVRLQVNLKQVSGQTLDGVIDWQNVHSSAILHVRTRLDRNNVRQMNAQIIAHNAIHADLLVGAILVRQHNANRFLASAALQQNRITAEQLQLVHLGLRQSDNGIVIVQCLFDQQPVGTVLALQDGGGQIIVTDARETLIYIYTKCSRCI